MDHASRHCDTRIHFGYNVRSHACIVNPLDGHAPRLGTGPQGAHLTGLDFSPNAIGWLPSIQRWAGTVAGLLRPGGRLFIREGGPALWAIDAPRPDGLIVTRYPYFEIPGEFLLKEGRERLPLSYTLQAIKQD